MDMGQFNSGLKKAYADACKAYYITFCNKHEFEIDDDPWVGDKPGGVAMTGDYYVDMQTMVDDIDMDVPEEEFLRWYDYCLRANCLKLIVPNFASWAKGCPRHSEEQLAELEIQLKIKR